MRWVFRLLSNGHRTWRVRVRVENLPFWSFSRSSRLAAGPAAGHAVVGRLHPHAAPASRSRSRSRAETLS